MGSTEKLVEFARWAIQTALDGYHLDGGEVQEKAAQLDLIQPEPYDPEKHGEDHLDIMEPGDAIYVFSDILQRKG